MKMISVILSLTLLSGCATVRHHPRATGVIAGALIGSAIGAAVTHRGCPYTENGEHYNICRK